MTGPNGTGLGTRCVHGGWRPGAAQRSAVLPIVQSSTFLLDDEAYAMRAAGRSDESRCYSRETNPTIEAVEGRLAVLEGAERALLFSSGMAAVHAVLLAGLDRGDRVACARELYGGSVSLVGELFPKLGVEVAWFDIADLDSARAASTGAKLVLCESLSNPCLVAADLPALADLAHEAGGRLVVDATFATPIAQRPLELGADLVWHSATKALNGHDDVIAGVVAGDADSLRPIFAWRMRAGGCADPHAAWLVDRGLRTLHLRVRAQAEGARVIAAALAEHAEVERVLHPSLPDHPSHAVAERVLDLPGGMLSFVVRGGDARAQNCLRHLALFTEAASLGGVESLVSMPARMSHVHVSPDERARLGIGAGFVRASIGVEDPADLVADLEHALAASRVGEHA